MAKLKTIKMVSKRLRLTKNKKVLKKKCGQDHFNAREAGKVTRHKRRGVELLQKTDLKNIRNFLHNS